MLLVAVGCGEGGSSRSSASGPRSPPEAAPGSRSGSSPARVAPTLPGEAPADAPATAEVPASPALPGDVLVQLHVPDTGELYRVALDGRYLVTEGGQETRKPPLSKTEPGAPVVSPRGLDRVREALDRAAFFALPARLPPSDCVPPGSVLPNSGRDVAPRVLRFSARKDGVAHTVEVRADLGAPCTLGALRPVYEALDVEALGDWMNE